MVKDKIAALLNEQISKEFLSSNIYLQMSAWCAAHGLENCAAFFKRHTAEEYEHMMRIHDFLVEAGHMPVIGALDAPSAEFDSVFEIIETAYEHEKYITESIHTLAHAAFEEKDLATFNHLQWFIEEQVEEEALFSGIIDKIELLGRDKRGLYLLEKEIGHLNAEIAAKGGGE